MSTVHRQHPGTPAAPARHHGARAAAPAAHHHHRMAGDSVQVGSGVHGRLMANRHNGQSNVRHHCFAYAWTMVQRSGGKGIGSAPASHAGRGRAITALPQMIASGQVRVGDVIYVSKRPGADPSSTKLAYGPHWFVYSGNGQFSDQYGVKSSAAQMQAFVPGRKIDTIYHPFA